MPQTEAREVRFARNQALFRAANERIQAINETFGAALDDADFLCECSDTGCDERIALTMAEYEHVRASGTRFFVRPGHEIEAIERGVEETERFAVVEKAGLAAEVVAAVDPRA